MKDKALNIIGIIAISLWIILVIFVLYNLYHLNRFKQCNDSEFTLDFCESYKGY